MALPCNIISLIFPSYSSSSITNHEYFAKTTNLFQGRSGLSANHKQYRISPATSNSESSTPQEHQLDPYGVVFQMRILDDYEEKIDKVRELVERRAEEDPIEGLIFADAIQRLGVAHHFENEIETIMEEHYFRKGNKTQSLRDVALSFRLLRQRGYHISGDAFNSFKGKDGKFKDEVKKDTWGLVELYEATQLSFEGEDILEEAQDFSSQILQKHLTEDPKFEGSNMVKMRLSYPYHTTITRSTDDDFLRGSIKYRWITNLKELSELQFLKGRQVHKDELLQVSEWWNNLDLNGELKMARNQPVKWYTWSMAMLAGDISLSAERVQLTKSIAFIYLIDDVFDLYGTPHELTIFTEAVKKWDYDAIDTLPHYMKLCYKSLLDTTNEIAIAITEKHRYNPINSLKQTWVTLCNAFLVEAKWLASNDLPRAEEYLANAKVSSGVHVVLVHLFFLLGLHAPNVDDISSLISCIAAILRLWDDLGSAKDEHQDGRDGSYVECYMRENQGLTFEQARDHGVDMIGKEWKRLNKEWFNLSNHSSMELQFKEAALNMARMVSLMYNYDQNQGLPALEAYVQLMLPNL